LRKTQQPARQNKMSCGGNREELCQALTDTEHDAVE
jgi:hypothetical protein